MRPNYINQDALTDQFTDTLATLFESQKDQRRLQLLEKARQHGLDSEEKKELVDLLNQRNQAVDLS